MQAPGLVRDSARSRAAIVAALVTVVGTIALDQLSKWAVLRWAPDWVFYNRNVAFSLPLPGWLVLATFGVIVLLAAWHWRAVAAAGARAGVAVGLLLGGAASNLIDRLVRGAVLDFINLRVWPVFNLADSAVVVGVVLVLWYAWRLPTDTGTSHATSPTTSERR